MRHPEGTRLLIRLVGSAGLEPAPPELSAPCSNQLSYEPIDSELIIPDNDPIMKGASPDKTDWLARPKRTTLESRIPARHLLRYCTSLLSYPQLKYQPASFGLAGILFACPLRGWGYNVSTDDAEEPLSSSGPLTLRDTIPNNANETKLFSVTPSTLPEYLVEVVPC